MSCYKCGRDVPPGNDASFFDAFLTRKPAIIMFSRPCHLLHIKEGGVVVCPGSPSRAQYIEGQPRDPRPEYAYKEECEALYRKAYQKTQKYREGEM